MIPENSQLIELPDRKEITLCEAVTAFAYGRACDVKAFQATHLNAGLGKELTAGVGKEQTKKQKAKQKEQTANQREQTGKVEGLLERLQDAAYAGNVKFRGIQEGADPADGYKKIDPLYFYVKPFFNWSQDVIFHREDEASTVWYFVHLDRNDFVSLLRDMGVSVQQSPDVDAPQGPDVDAPRKQKTYTTGSPGRPTSRHLVLPMAQRKLDGGYRPKDLTVFSEELAKELETTEPEAAPMTPNTIRNAIRKLWHEHQKPPKIIDRS